MLETLRIACLSVGVRKAISCLSQHTLIPFIPLSLFPLPLSPHLPNIP
ncbi:hypothetical protein FDUTEX481_10019 [Tolypothrix sp. PCC 7601]|nr:hypothetical protein FDUTEX481_10019 [Tolypothrix sp. PCC 7601]